jgi:hypothetical protein
MLALVATAGFAALLAWRAYAVLETSIALDARANTPWATPVWIPQTAWFAGLSFLVLTAVVLIGATAAAIARGDVAAAQSLAGAPDTQEEVDAEMEEAKRQLGLAGEIG